MRVDEHAHINTFAFCCPLINDSNQPRITKQHAFYCPLINDSKQPRISKHTCVPLGESNAKLSTDSWGINVSKQPHVSKHACIPFGESTQNLSTDSWGSSPEGSTRRPRELCSGKCTSTSRGCASTRRYALLNLISQLRQQSVAFCCRFFFTCPGRWVY